MSQDLPPLPAPPPQGIIGTVNVNMPQSNPMNISMPLAELMQIVAARNNQYTQFNNNSNYGRFAANGYNAQRGGGSGGHGNNYGGWRHQNNPPNFNNGGGYGQQNNGQNFNRSGSGWNGFNQQNNQQTFNPSQNGLDQGAFAQNELDQCQFKNDKNTKSKPVNNPDIHSILTEDLSKTSEHYFSDDDSISIGSSKLFGVHKRSRSLNSITNGSEGNINGSYGTLKPLRNNPTLKPQANKAKANNKASSSVANAH